MSAISRTRLAAVVAAVTALASSGGVAAILATSVGNGHASALTATGRRSPTDPATTASVAPARHILASPAPSRTPSASAAKASGKVAEKPPPVVDGVRRTSVGAAHSPQLARQLSGAKSAAPPPADAGALGVDVADYQHPRGAAIDWPRVAAAGYKFAFLKATEGDYYGNPYYSADLAQAKAAGLQVAGYHFAVPNVSGGASQADYAVRSSHYTAGGPTLPLALDIEYNPYGAECYRLSARQMVSWVSAFTTEVRRLTGHRPIIYTTADWWHTCTGGSTAFGSDPLWVAAYGSASPPMPAGWGDWTFWQYTSQGSVPGITGNVDLSYFLRTGANGVRFAATVTPRRPPSPSSPPAPSHAVPPSLPSTPSNPGPPSLPPSPPSSTSPAPSPSSPSPSQTPSSPISSTPSPSPTPSSPISSTPSPSPTPSSPSPSPSPSSPSAKPTESPSPGTTPSGSLTGGSAAGTAPAASG